MTRPAEAGFGGSRDRSACSRTWRRAGQVAGLHELMHLERMRICDSRYGIRRTYSSTSAFHRAFRAGRPRCRSDRGLLSGSRAVPGSGAECGGPRQVCPANLAWPLLTTTAKRSRLCPSPPFFRHFVRFVMQFRLVAGQPFASPRRRPDDETSHPVRLCASSGCSGCGPGRFPASKPTCAAGGEDMPADPPRTGARTGS